MLLILSFAETPVASEPIFAQGREGPPLAVVQWLSGLPERGYLNRLHSRLLDGAAGTRRGLALDENRN